MAQVDVPGRPKDRAARTVGRLMRASRPPAAEAPRRRTSGRAPRFAAWLLPLLPLLPFDPSGYRIDDARSRADFGVRLLWLHEIVGHFRHIDGTVLPGPRPDTMVVSADIAVDSVAMDSERTRRWLLAPEFFDAKDYPFIHFVSDPLPRSLLDDGGTLPGRLGLRGVTEPVSFVLHPMHCTHALPATCRISLSGSLQRSDFGMSAHRAALSDKVELDLAIVLTPLTPPPTPTRIDAAAGKRP